MFIHFRYIVSTYIIIVALRRLKRFIGNSPRKEGRGALLTNSLDMRIISQRHCISKIILYLYGMAKRMKVRNYKIHSDNMHSCMSWCLSNGIKIYISGSMKNEHKVQVNNNGKLTTSPEDYSIVDATEKVWELYCHFYNLHT